MHCFLKIAVSLCYALHMLGNKKKSFFFLDLLSLTSRAFYVRELMRTLKSSPWPGWLLVPLRQGQFVIFAGRRREESTREDSPLGQEPGEGSTRQAVGQPTPLLQVSQFWLRCSQGCWISAGLI